MNFGLDDALRNSIEQQYRRATGAGLWTGLYAATNPQEYWAELAMWYFGAHGERGAAGPADGSAAFAAYDAEGHALLDKICSGTLRPSAVRIAPVHVGGGPRELRSGSSTSEASVVLMNNSSRAYAVQWLNFRGQPIDYGELEPMSYRVMKTYVTHAWQLKDMASGRASQFVVEVPFSRWSVDD
jgi:hypothetical protein